MTAAVPVRPLPAAPLVPVPSPLPRVVVVGGGFAGLEVVRGLRRAKADIVLIDRRNFSLFQPLLYQVATGLLSPANIATPLRSLFARQRNVRIQLANVRGVDLAQRRIELTDGEMRYDYLVVACGARHQYFGKPEWEHHAPGLKSLEDAEDIRARIFLALEQAERTDDPDERLRLLTFVIVGGGPTSVELAGSVAEITRYATRSGFHTLTLGSCRIVMVEARDRVLGGFSARSSAEALRALSSLGVDVMLDSRVNHVDSQGVTLVSAAGEQVLPAATVLWGAGVRASPIAAALATAAGIALGPSGCLPVAEDCSLPGHPEVLVLGDMAHFVQDGTALPGTAQVAMRQGEHAARLIAARLRGCQEAMPFRFQNKGSMATIGKRLAVVDIGRLHLRGRLAWILWLWLHLFQLVRVENRLLVIIQWAWSYVSWSRAASLVTGEDSDRMREQLANDT